MLPGKKTYALSIFGIVGSIGNIVNKLMQGEPITMQDIEALIGSIALGTLRAGISKAAGS